MKALSKISNGYSKFSSILLYFKLVLTFAFFDFLDFEDYYIGGNVGSGTAGQGAGNGSAVAAQWPFAYHDGTSNANGNTCFGCAHTGT